MERVGCISGQQLSRAGEGLNKVRYTGDRDGISAPVITGSPRCYARGITSGYVGKGALRKKRHVVSRSREGNGFQCIGLRENIQGSASDDVSLEAIRRKVGRGCSCDLKCGDGVGSRVEHKHLVGRVRGVGNDDLGSVGRNSEYFTWRRHKLTRGIRRGIKNRETHGAQPTGISAEVNLGPLPIKDQRVWSRWQGDEVPQSVRRRSDRNDRAEAAIG